MTFSPLPAKPAELLTLMSNALLAEHASAALKLLALRGVDLPAGLVDQVEEVHVECIAREPGAAAKLARILAQEDFTADAANSNRVVEAVQ